MVFTPFHYPFAYFIHRLSKRRLRMETLILACFLPDIEVPILWVLGIIPSRLILHSILGSIILAPVMMYLLYPLYRYILKSLFDINYTRESILLFVISSITGSLSHVLIDTLHHPYNPLLWPFTRKSIDVLVLFGDYELASLLMHAIFIGLTVLLIYKAYKQEAKLTETIRILITGNY